MQLKEKSLCIWTLSRFLDRTRRLGIGNTSHQTDFLLTPFMSDLTPHTRFLLSFFCQLTDSDTVLIISLIFPIAPGFWSLPLIFSHFSQLKFSLKIFHFSWTFYFFFSKMLFSFQNLLFLFNIFLRT